MSAEPTTEEGSSLIGRVVGGKIRIDAHLGSGAMGHVYRAHHLTLHKDVAVKVMRKLDGQADVHARRFAREARTASQIDHPNSVAILDFGEDGPDRLLYLAMEFVEGEELQSILTRDGGLTAERTCEVMIQALGAIAHAHDKGVIHRDLKPSNLILTQRTNDEGQRVDFVKVCDFGLAKFVSGVRDSLDGSAASAAKVVGTPAYMSPEQAVGDALDVRSDLYSVGVILYEMFTGRLPFDAETPMGVMLKHVAEEPVPPSHHAPYLPTDVDRVVMWALRKPRSQRCQTARELRNAVRQLLLQMSGELSAVALPRPVEPSYAMTSEEEPLPLPASALMPAADEPSLTDDLVAQPQQFADLSMDLELPPATPAIPETESLDVAPAELDMEALVNEAVQSVAEEAHSGSTQPQQDSFLLAGLDPRNVSAEVSDRAMYMWNHYGITFEPYEGEHAFWVRDHRGKEMGPLALEDMIRIVSTEGAAGHAHDVSVAVEAGQWLPATTFARLTGQEALLDHAVYMPASSSGDVLSGDLERTSLAALFTRIAKDGPTGRLRFELLVQQSQIRFELHLAAGRPTFVYANEPSLQLPRLLVQQGLVQEHLLPRFLAMVIADERPMEAVVGQVASMDLSAYRAVFMRERLAFLFKNARGRFSLDTQALPARTEPFAPTLLALLPELVYRAMPLGALQAEVAPYMTKPLSRSERFKSDARHLRLSQSQVDVVRALLRSPNLAEAMPSDGRQRLYMAMAYVLVETGLLLPPL